MSDSAAALGIGLHFEHDLRLDADAIGHSFGQSHLLRRRTVSSERVRASFVQRGPGACSRFRGMRGNLPRISQEEILSVTSNRG